jgi:putative transposase
MIRTPVRSPRANAFADRFVGTVRRECFDRMLVFHRGHLERILSEFVDHYNNHRPHRSPGQHAHLALPKTQPRTSANRIQISGDGATSSAALFTSVDSSHELVG